DRIGTARVARLRPGPVVLALAIGPADRMDRYEIDDVKTERGDFREADDTIVKARAPARLAALAAWKHLVPSGEASRFAVDDDFEFARIAHRVTAHRAARHQLAQPRGAHQLCATGGIAAIEIAQPRPDRRSM